jgi:ArsR family transcriptional regulator, arsenate/arsenite/antimonite-responsive transcriptional repressor
MKTVHAKPVVCLDRIFRALSDRTRLRILHLLLPGELCVCHLVDVLDLPQPKVSRHLAYLRGAGLVIARKEGLWNYYRLAPAKSEFQQKLLQCLESGFREMSEPAHDAEQLKKSIRQWCC